MLGSNKQLKTEKQLKGLGRGIIDRSVDAKNGIPAIRLYDYRVVQLASTCIGHEQRNKVKSWSAKKNKTIEIECPAMVEEYNAHIGGFVPVQNSIEYVQVLHAYGIRVLLHGHFDYKWMVTISEILRTKARLKKKTNGFMSISIEHCKCSFSGQQEKVYSLARPPIIIIHPRWPFSCQEALLCSILYPLKISDLIE